MGFNFKKYFRQNSSDNNIQLRLNGGHRLSYTLGFLILYEMCCKVISANRAILPSFNAANTGRAI